MTVPLPRLPPTPVARCFTVGGMLLLAIALLGTVALRRSWRSLTSLLAFCLAVVVLCSSLVAALAT